jgi:hypothetical protein
MAFVKTPTTWLPNWSENGTDITLPIASLPELTAAEADAATGDIRKIFFAIMRKLFSVWTATAIADRPTKMTMQKASSIDPSTNILTETYTIKFICDVSAQDVSDEPT